jgi:alpha-beta hydrolase superfamily lysophospholipase
MSKPFIVLIHGLGAHTERWDFLKKYLNNYDCLAVPIDHSAHSFETYYQLLNKTISADAILIGESMGGLIAWNFAARYPEKVSKLILLSPAFKGKLRFSPRNICHILLRTNKPLALSFTPDECTQDSAYQKIMRNNPKEIRQVPAWYIWNIFTEQLKARRYRPTMPTLTLLADHDTMIDTAAAIRQVKNNYKIYPNTRHALSIEKNREQIFSDMVQWLQGTFS